MGGLSVRRATAHPGRAAMGSGHLQSWLQLYLFADENDSCYNEILVLNPQLTKKNAPA
ncbi:MAG: hypothetical protein AABZ67_03165 [Pseudomonadota bacterium]